MTNYNEDFHDFLDSINSVIASDRAVARMAASNPFSQALTASIEHARIGATRACPDCGRPQHYTGTEHGWAHDALVDTWHCADPRKAGACPDDFVATASLAPDEMTEGA